MDMFKIAIIAILLIIAIGFFSVFGDYITRQIVNDQRPLYDLKGPECRGLFTDLSTFRNDQKMQQYAIDKIIELDCEIPQYLEIHFMSQEELSEFMDGTMGLSGEELSEYMDGYTCRSCP